MRAITINEISFCEDATLRSTCPPRERTSQKPRWELVINVDSLGRNFRFGSNARVALSLSLFSVSLLYSLSLLRFCEIQERGS